MFMKLKTTSLILALTFVAPSFAAAASDPFSALIESIGQAFSGGGVVDARPVRRAPRPSARDRQAPAGQDDSGSGFFGLFSDQKSRWSSEGSSWRQTCPQERGRYVNVVGYLRSNRLVVRCGEQTIREFYTATAKVNPKTGAPYYTPTGTFPLRRNANTHYHAAWIFYQAATGNPYEIHGYKTNDWESSQPGNWTVGCFALRNFEMDWLSGQVQNGTRFTIVDR